ncbi:MAG: DNA mismatch repair protein MutS [Planctomycetota bacterium]|nr:MAG: DNA mismatch repair protein MutS [Planctomycetota bacterium]
MLVPKTVKKTPLMEQYDSIKKDHSDKLLFFRMGDFYELFNEDAEVASKVLGITLTKRGKDENAAPLAGIPYHALEQYLPKVIRAGHKAAICEQIEDPALAQGIVKRAVTRIITPGTLIEENLLDGKSNNYICSIFQNKDTFGVSIADLSTGEFGFEVFSFKEAINFISRIWPAECILCSEENQSSNLYKAIQENTTALINFHPAWSFDFNTANQQLLDHFGVSTLEGFGFLSKEVEAGIQSCGGLMSYLLDTQKTSIDQISRIKRMSQNNHLLIDRITQKNLELIRPLHNDGIALVDVIDDTITSMGARLFRRWLTEPLTDIDSIEKRHHVVQELFDESGTLVNLRKKLKLILDIERILTRVCAKRVGPRELISLKNSLSELPEIKSLLINSKVDLLQKIIQNFDKFNDVVELITKTLKEDPPIKLSDGGFIADGIHDELDELRNISMNGKETIANMQKELSEELGIAKLKVGYNRVFGYYFEVSKLHIDKIPDTFIRKQTLTNAERFISPELKEYESKVLGAQEKIIKIEQRLYEELLNELIKQVIRIQLLAEDISQLDVFSSFASTALNNDYHCPQINLGLDLIIKDGRHPVVEHLLQHGKFVSNDLLMKYNEDQIMLITGPNMAGKSTYIRQIAIISIMAQMGSFVPAASVSLGIIDKIFTRVGASDDLSKGHSTFMVEMTETANILNNATNKSLVILDEVGRGTSTFDGVSLAWAITEYLHTNEKVAARTIFATHYHELLEMETLFERVTNYNVSVKEWKGDIIFQHKIVKGGSDKSYGIHVAKLAGLPKPVINRAQDILKKLEKLNFDINGETRKLENVLPDYQLTMFSESEEKLCNTIKELDINSLTPLDALIKLKELQKIADDTAM